MTAQQDVLGFVDPGRQIRRPPLVGMQFLHQRPVRARDVFPAGPLTKAENLIRFILGHGGSARAPRPRAAAPRIVLSLSCLTPTGKPAIEISL